MRFFTYKKSIYCIIAFIAVVYLIRYYDPFDVNVWGTVADWVMIIVTAITGIIIWFTLRSQTKVQELQQSLLTLEYRKYSIETIPRFDVDITSIHEEILEDVNQFYLNVTFTFILQKKYLKNLNIEVRNSGKTWLDDSRNVYRHSSLNKASAFKLNFYTSAPHGFQYDANRLKRPFFMEAVEFTLKYQDDLRNKIVQIVRFEISNLHPTNKIVHEPHIESSIYE